MVIRYYLLAILLLMLAGGKPVGEGLWDGVGNGYVNIMAILNL
jgi:hypothetical protein